MRRVPPIRSPRALAGLGWMCLVLAGCGGRGDERVSASSEGPHRADLLCETVSPAGRAEFARALAQRERSVTVRAVIIEPTLTAAPASVARLRETAWIVTVNRLGSGRSAEPWRFVADSAALRGAPDGIVVPLDARTARSSRTGRKLDDDPAIRALRAAVLADKKRMLLADLCVSG